MGIFCKKNIYCFFIRFILCVTLLCLGVGVTTLAHGAEPLRVVYGFDREFPPFSYEEPGGEAVGFEVELAKAVFRGADVALSMRPLSWDMVQLELSSGGINLASGMIKTEQRAKNYLFAETPNIPLQIRLFTKVYNRYPSATLLRGQTVSVEKGSYQQRLLEAFGGINIKQFSGRVDGLRALFYDEVTAYCGPVQPTYYYINKLNYGAITTVGTPLGTTEVYFAANRGRGDIQRILNKGMAEVVASGEYDRLYRKWFVRELTEKEVTTLQSAAKEAAIPAYVPYGMAATGAAILTVTGKVYSACNIENAEEDLNLSALRLAVGKAISDGEFELRAALITSSDGKLQNFTADELQTLYEFGRGILVVSPSSDGYHTDMVAQKITHPITRSIATLNIE